MLMGSFILQQILPAVPLLWLPVNLRQWKTSFHAAVFSPTTSRGFFHLCCHALECIEAVLWGQRTGPGRRPQTWNITLCLWLPFSRCLIFLAFSLLTGRTVSSYNICSTLGELAVLLNPPLVSSEKQILKNYSLILIKEELCVLTLHDKASLFKGLESKLGCLCHTAGASDH